MLSQALSSLILAVKYPVSKKINILVNIAFGFNAFRLFGRIASMLFNIHLFDSFSGVLYLPFVIFIYGMLTTWLFLHQVNGNIRVSDFEKME
jgi:hypothetical protein